MSRHVMLHGGPLHGKEMAVPAGWTCIAVETFVPPAEDYFNEQPSTPADHTITTKTGHYSQVAGRPDDFEWDGWRPHQNE